MVMYLAPINQNLLKIVFLVGEVMTVRNVQVIYSKRYTWGGNYK